jgi:hypothetical protein
MGKDELNEEMEFWLPSIKEGIKNNGVINVYKRIYALNLDGVISDECFNSLIPFIDDKYHKNRPIEKQMRKSIDYSDKEIENRSSGSTRGTGGCSGSC